MTHRQSGLRLIYMLLIAVCMITPTESQTETPEPTPFNVDSTRTGQISAIFTASNTEPLIGEPFTLRLRIEHPPEVTITAFPELPDMSPMEILQSTEITSGSENGSLFMEQSYQVVMWQTGPYMTPEIPVEVQSAGDTFLAPVRSLSINVPSVLAESADHTPRPSIPQARLPHIPTVIPIGAAVVVIIVMMGGVFIKKRQSMPASMDETARSAIHELEDLREAPPSPAQTLTVISLILRRYLQDQFKIHALEQTTDEVLAQIAANTMLSRSHRDQIERVLSQADLVKFARYTPDELLSRQTIDYTLRLIREIERTSQPEEADISDE